MKLFNKYILEAILKGINIALDDFEDEEILTLKDSTLIDKNSTLDELFIMENFVDLGLPSGTLWAKYNIGCDWRLLSSDPKKTNASDWFGNHYGWGEIETKLKSEYALEKYKFYRLSSRFNSGIGSWVAETSMTKYNDDDNLLTLLPEDDISSILYGRYIHIPSEKLFKELFFLDYRYVKYKYVKDLYGIMFKGKNGNELFLPAAGYYNAVGLENVYDCYYWSRDRLKDTKDLAYFYYANNRTASINCGNRSLGLNIRPVFNTK